MKTIRGKIWYCNLYDARFTIMAGPRTCVSCYITNATETLPNEIRTFCRTAPRTTYDKNWNVEVKGINYKRRHQSLYGIWDIDVVSVKLISDIESQR